MNGAGCADLTGVWLGLYSYPRRFDPVGFTAILIETAGTISGSSHEDHRQAPFRARRVFATLCGRHSESAVEFVKTYDDGRPHSRPISYEGSLMDDGAEIEGRWTISRMWSGRFLMIRFAPNAEAVIRRKYERA
ncbi:MAG TPA: hypothetical protein VMF67_15535 [Rhizomicrobium sp.]|nr:hypothetical protein [Rhizomicrobium sp.]